MIKRNKVLVVAVLFIASHITALYSQKHYDSYSGLVMAGYQGWFNTPADGTGRGWHHLGKHSGFKPGSCNIDLWPDVAEYSKTYPTDFRMSDGSVAKIFSSADKSTVDTHFRWMKEYGIDGVFMQRFVAEIKNKSGLRHFNNVLANAFDAATANERAICIMYDLSGMRAGDARVVLSDIDSLAMVYDLKTRRKSPTYLYHNHKPLVCIWGVGFNDGRNYGLADAEQIVDGLRSRGFSVMLGVPTYWRELRADTEADQGLHSLIRKCDILLPWFVGRYNEESYPEFSKIIPEDIKWCKKNNILYVPLVYPGFSWKNMKGKNTVQIPRNKGLFFWKQITGALSAGCSALYVAMFDEMDEGTAIFKAATQVPVGESEFINIEKNTGNDYYLWLTGKAGMMLRKGTPFTTTIPVRK